MTLELCATMLILVCHTNTDMQKANNQETFEELDMGENSEFFEEMMELNYMRKGEVRA